VSHKLKHHSDHFRLTSAVLVRLIIFIIIIAVAINYFSQHQPKPPAPTNSAVLGDQAQATASSSLVITEGLQSAYSLLPESSRHFIENFNQSSLYQDAQKKIDYLRDQTQDFPAKQIKDLQKGIIDKLYQDLINNINSK